VIPARGWAKALFRQAEHLISDTEPLDIIVLDPSRYLSVSAGLAFPVPVPVEVAVTVNAAAIFAVLPSLMSTTTSHLESGAASAGISIVPFTTLASDVTSDATSSCPPATSLSLVASWRFVPFAVISPVVPAARDVGSTSAPL
jgi:hypothetical protein